MKVSTLLPLILNPSFIWAKNPKFSSVIIVKTGFSVVLRMSDVEVLGVKK